jgi:hypothetical protein
MTTSGGRSSIKKSRKMRSRNRSSSAPMPNSVVYVLGEKVLSVSRKSLSSAAYAVASGSMYLRKLQFRKRDQKELVEEKFGGANTLDVFSVY